MRNWLRLFALARWLSLDVALGALASGAMVVRYLGIEMPWSWWLALPLSLWVIYTADHLLDAYRLGTAAHTDRHRFHARHFRLLAVLWGLGLLGCVAWLPWQLPGAITRFGLIMGGLTLGHLTLVWLIGGRVSWLFHKELGVGLIYSLGVWGGPWVMAPAVPDGFWGLFGQFLLLALMNLLIFSRYERHTDALDGHTSFVRAIGPQATRWLVMGLGGLVLGLGLVSRPGAIPANWWAVQAIYGAMLAILLLILWREDLFRPRDRYRIWGDAAFLLPALLAGWG